VCRPSGNFRRLGQVIALVVASWAFSAAAAAQVPTSGNVFFGYSFENTGSSSFDFDNMSRPSLNGWEASLEGKVFPWVGIVADVGGHYGSQNYQQVLGSGPSTVTINVNGHELTALFGPRVSVTIKRFRPFAEALFGVAHIKTSHSSPLPDNFLQPSDTAFATALGGGLDYKIIKPVALRVQGDYVQTRFFGTTQNDVRLSTGIVLRF
jgi:opacity protein-like surface antigen